MDKESFGKLLVMLREQKGISQKEKHTRGIKETMLKNESIEIDIVKVSYYKSIDDFYNYTEPDSYCYIFLDAMRVI